MYQQTLEKFVELIKRNEKLLFWKGLNSSNPLQEIPNVYTENKPK